MVLPPPAPDLEEGARAAVGRLRRLLSLGHEGTLIFAVGGDAWVGRLWRGLAEVEGVRWPAATPMDIPEAPEGAFVLCQALPEDAEWLNVRRPVFEGRGLRVVMLVTPETRRTLRRRARDFFDWVSHSVELPDVPYRHVIASLRAGLVGNIGYAGEDAAQILRWVTAAPVRERSADDAWDVWMAERGTSDVLVVRDAATPEDVGWVQSASAGRAGILFVGGAFSPAIRVPSQRWRTIAAPGVEGARRTAMLDLEAEAIARIGDAPLDETADDPAAAWARAAGVVDGLLGLRASPRPVGRGEDGQFAALLDVISGAEASPDVLAATASWPAEAPANLRMMAAIARATALARAGAQEQALAELRVVEAGFLAVAGSSPEVDLALGEIRLNIARFEQALGRPDVARAVAGQVWATWRSLATSPATASRFRAFATVAGLTLAELQQRAGDDPAPVASEALRLLQPLLSVRGGQLRERVALVDLAVRLHELRADRAAMLALLEAESGSALQVLAAAPVPEDVSTAAGLLQRYVDQLYQTGDAASAGALDRRLIRALRRRGAEPAMGSVVEAAIQNALVSATAAALAVGDLPSARSAVTELRQRRRARVEANPEGPESRSDCWVADLLAAEVELAASRGDLAEPLLREATAGLTGLVDRGAVDVGTLRRLAFGHERLAALSERGNAEHAEAALDLRRRAFALAPGSPEIQAELGVTLSMVADALGDAGTPARAEAAALLVPLWRRGALQDRHVPLAQQLAATQG